jgi:hypothetical protein
MIILMKLSDHSLATEISMDMDLSYIPELQSSDKYEQITAPGELDERTNSLRF